MSSAASTRSNRRSSSSERRALGPVQPVQVADETQQLAAGQLGVQVRLVGHIAAGRLGLQRLLHHIKAAHFHRPPDGRSSPTIILMVVVFPAPSAQKTKDLSGRNLETDIIHRQFIAVAFDEVRGFNSKV